MKHLKHLTDTELSIIISRLKTTIRMSPPSQEQEFRPTLDAMVAELTNRKAKPSFTHSRGTELLNVFDKAAQNTGYLEHLVTQAHRHYLVSRSALLTYIRELENINAATLRKTK